ncbi:MAG TPA: hypothetical protein VGE76_05110 [Opitutaceae bacterium]
MTTIASNPVDAAAVRRRRFEAEMVAIREEAARRYAHLPRPLKISDGPWALQRSRRRRRVP